MTISLDKIKKFSDVSQRVLFDDLESSMPYLQKLQELKDADEALAGVKIAIHGYAVNDSGDLQPIEGKEWPIGSDGNPFACMVAVLNKKDKATNKQLPRAIIAWPAPRVSQLLETELGANMVSAVIEKELNHRIVRPLRDSDNLAAALNEVPASIDEFCTSGREASSGSLLAVYNELFLPITNAIKEQVPAYKQAKINKKDLRSCIENAAYASHYYPVLEEHGLFTIIGQMFVKAGGESNYDVSQINTWLATRDTQSFEVNEDAGLEGLSVNGLLAGLTDDSTTD